MATRGVFGIIQNNDFKGFFKTGALLPYFLRDIRDMIEDIPEDFDLSSIPLVPSEHGERGTKEYELNSLIDIDTDKYLIGKENSSDNWINSVSISSKDSGITPLNNFGYNLPDASFRPLDGLFIELVVIANLDDKTIDIYKHGIFNFYPELKECSSGEEFVEKAKSFGQKDNIFVDMYAKHYVDFKKCDEKLKSMSSADKRKQDFTSRETHKFLTSNRMFDFGPVTKIASIKFSILDEPATEENSIIKSYICFETLGSAIETYYVSKADTSFEETSDSKALLHNLNSLIENNGFLTLYI